MSRLTDYSKFDHIGDSSSDEEGPAHHHRRQHQPPPPPPLPSSKPTAAPPSSQQPEPQTSTDPPTVTTTAATTTAKTSETSKASDAAAPTRHHRTTTKKTAEGRYVFECDGRKVYEWEQSLDEVNLYIDVPPQIQAHQLQCTISTHHLQIGLRDADRSFLDEPTFSKVNTTDSSWYLDDAHTLNIVLAKVYRGETWECALRGNLWDSSSGGRGEAAAAAAAAAAQVDPATKEEMQRTMMLERFQEEHPGFDFRDAEFNGTVPDPRTFMGGIGYS